MIISDLQRLLDQFEDDHPWLYIYTVITSLLFGYLTIGFLIDCLKGTLP